MDHKFINCLCDSEAKHFCLLYKTMTIIKHIIIPSLVASLRRHTSVKLTFIKPHTKSRSTKMKMFIVFVAVIVGVALAAPLDESKDAVILKYENDNIGIDGYKFA